jgi:hypothetical protein
MATNLVSLIMQFLTPDMIGPIASALGLDRNNTQTAIGAVVPGAAGGVQQDCRSTRRRTEAGRRR